MILADSVTCPRIKKRFKTIEGEFEDKYGKDRFDYSETIYYGMMIPFTFKCNICGNYITKKPATHISPYNKGCIHCAGKYKPTLVEFVEKAVCIHGDKYDYTNFIYKNKDKVGEIKCNICGNIFLQSPHNHIYHRKGCKICSDRLLWSRYLNTPTKLYYIKFMFDNIPYYKIGITTKSIEARFESDLRYLKEIILCKEFNNGLLAFDAEQEIIRINNKYLAKGVKFLRGGNTELFYKNIYENVLPYFQ